MQSRDLWTAGPCEWEDARSVWGVKGQKGEGAASLRDVQDIVRQVGCSVDDVDTTRCTGDISIEIIRHADDIWSLCIDGCVVNGLGFLEEGEADEENYPIVGLPPPLPPDSMLTHFTQARSLRLSCRVECDALRPAKVEVCVRQMVITSDPAVVEPSTPKDVCVYSVLPYTPDDVRANVLVLPYLFVVTPPSVMAIVCHKDGQHRREQSTYLMDVMRSAFNRMNGPPPPDDPDEEAPARAAPNGPPPTDDPDKVVPSRLLIIGGNEHASVALESLIHVIKAAWDTIPVISIPVKTKVSRKNCLVAVRWYLLHKKEHNALLLWDALCFGARATSTDLGGLEPQGTEGIACAHDNTWPSPSTVVVEGDGGGGCGNATAAIGVASPQAAANAEVGAADLQKRKDGEPPSTDFPFSYDFIYDMMRFGERDTTMLTTDLRLTITEADGTRRHAVVRPRPAYGHAAYSIYSKLEVAEESLRSAIRSLVSVILVATSLTPWDVLRATFLKRTSLTDKINDWARRKDATWPLSQYTDAGSGQIIEAMKLRMVDLFYRTGFNTGQEWPPPRPMESNTASSASAPTAVVVEAGAPAWVQPTTWVRTLPLMLTGSQARPYVFHDVASSNLERPLVYENPKSTKWLSTKFINPIAPVVASYVATTFSPSVFLASAAGPTAVGLLSLYTFFSTLATAIPFGRDVNKYVVECEEVRLKIREKNRDIYTDALYRMQGDPAQRMLHAARLVARVVHKSGLTFMECDSNGVRTCIEQFYYVSDAERLRSCFHRIHNADDWCLGVCTGLVSPQPPTDVYRMWHGAVVQRVGRTADAIRFVTGSTVTEDASSIAMEATSAVVHADLLASVAAGRSTLVLEHTVVSATTSASNIVRRAANILDIVYGTSNASDIVDRDDILWSCVHGGAAARSSLQHLDIFWDVVDGRSNRKVKMESALAAWHATALFAATNDDTRDQASNTERVLRAMDTDEWRAYRKARQALATPRRLSVADIALIKSFCATWVRDSERRKRELATPPDRSLLDATHTPSRAFALGMLRRLSAMNVEMSMDFIALTLPGFKKLATLSSNEVSPSRNTRPWSVPHVTPPKQMDHMALLRGWAATRLDVMTIRRIGVLDRSFADTIKLLAGPPQDTITHYYRPVGHFDGAAMSGSPFYGANMPRAVSIAAVVTQLRDLAGALTYKPTSQLYESEWPTMAVQVDRRGFARHPLVLTESIHGVRLSLSGVLPLNQTSNVASLPGQAAEMANRARRVHGVARSVRTLLFNTDRFKQGITLMALRKYQVAVVPLDAQYVYTRLPALAIGCVQSFYETGYAGTSLMVVTDAELPPLRAWLNNLASQLESAMSSGCTAVYVHEMCVAIATTNQS